MDMSSELELLFNHLQKDIPLKEKYPQLINKKGTKILFISPVLTAEGIYKMILPAIELAKYNEYNTIITKIHKYDPENPNQQHDSPIHEDLIKWADYINFPFMTDNIAPLIDQIKKINKNVEISMHMDISFWNVPNWHPFHELYNNKETQEAIMSNIKAIDLLIVSNDKIKDAFIKHYGDQLKQVRALVINMPLLISQYIFPEEQFEKIIKQLPEPPNPKSRKKVKIGIIGNIYDYADIKSIIPVIDYLHSDKLKNKCQLILFGYNGDEIKFNRKNEKQVTKNFILDKLQIKYFHPVTYFKYFEKVKSLELDFVIIPSAEDEFSKLSRSYTKFLELSLLGIPCILQNVDAFRKILESDPYISVLANNTKEWKDQIDLFVKNGDKRIDLGIAAKEYVLKNWVYTQSKMKLFTSIFPIKTAIERRHVL